MSASLSGQRAAGSSAGAASPDACTPTPLDAETRFGDQTPAELRSSSDACRPSSGCTGHAAVAGSLQSPSDGTRAEPSDPNAPARHHRQTAGCPARDPAGGKHVGRRSAAEQRRDPKAGGAPGEARCLVLELFYVDLRRPNSVSGAAAPVAELLQEFNSRTCARAAGPHDPRCANTVAEASAPAGAATPVRSAEEASANTAVRGPRSATDAAPAQTAGAQTAKKAQAAAPLPAGAAATTARPQHIQHSRGSSPPVQAARAPACPTYCPAWFSVESQAPSNEPLPRADLPAGEAAAAPVQPQHGSSPPVQVARAPACSTYRPPGVESQAPSSKPLRAEHVTRALPPRSCAGYPCPGCAEIVEVSHAFCSGCGGRLQAPCLPAEAAPELLCTAFYFKPAEHPRCPTGGDSSAACRLTGSFGGANVAIAHARFSWEHELRCPDGSTAGVDDPPPRLSHVFGFFNAFGVLRVPLDCGGDEVRTAFRREMLLSHPDKNSSRGAGAAATDTILRAREHLLDGGKRAQLEAEVQKAVRRHGKTAVYRHIPQRGLVQEKKHGAAMREGSVPHDSFFV
ncbi:hypothetical protein DIPPA_30078 [Diplonema papillatum]|nr:hypothetical protein DIPPA_30078 [Diplonema papillatum]